MRTKRNEDGVVTNVAGILSDDLLICILKNIHALARVVLRQLHHRISLSLVANVR